MSRLLDGKQGQMRLVEVVFASLIVFLAFAFASYVMAPMNAPIVRGKGDLEVMAYNLLDRLAREGVLEDVVLGGRETWEQELKIVITRMISPSLYFNVTIYNATKQDAVAVSLNRLPHEPITNVDKDEAREAFSKSPEVASANFIYTSYHGSILLFRIVIARSGERG